MVFSLKLAAPFGAVLMAAAAARAEPTFFTARVAPLLERHCVTCHGEEKHKAGLRLDSLDHLLRGAESGPVVHPGDLKESELYRRITLPSSDEEAMPGDGKPRLTADEIKILELWIAGGASATKTVSDFPGAPALKPAARAVIALAPDWRARAGEIAALAQQLGLKIVPRSQLATDGLVVRTASAPARCDDAAVAKLAALAPFIVEAELARTRISDTALASIAQWTNLRALDLTRTAVTSQGVRALTTLTKLESLNLTGTDVDAAAVAALRAQPTLKRLWVFGTKAEVVTAAASSDSTDIGPGSAGR
jgi:hypothetical protein